MIHDINQYGVMIQPKTNTTLKAMTKTELIEYVRTLEHNYNVAVDFNERQARNVEKMLNDKWIPCSERLPEPKREEFVRNWYIVTLATGAVVEKCFDFIKKEWVTDIEVIAWMPLPEPFKEGGAV